MQFSQIWFGFALSGIDLNRGSEVYAIKDI